MKTNSKIEKLNVSEITSKIRDFVNNSVIKRTDVFSKKNEGYWGQFCSALDTIGDTSVAIESFLSITNEDFLKNLYLNTYGVLQALFLQQDAVNHLKVSLFGEDKRIIWKIKYPELDKIRELRNETIGHPTKTNKKGRESKFNKDEVSSCMISRHSLSKDGFDYFLYRHSGSEHKHIKFQEVINLQDNNLEVELSKILKELQKEEKKHKVKFKDEKLADLLSESSFYKINLIYGVNHDDSLAWHSFNHYLDKYKKTRGGLEKRYGKFGEITRIQGTELVIKKLDYIFSRMETFKKTGNFEEQEFEIYVDALDINLEELRNHLREIDNEFKL